MGDNGACPVCRAPFHGRNPVPVSGHYQCEACGYVVATCCEGHGKDEVIA